MLFFNRWNINFIIFIFFILHLFKLFSFDGKQIIQNLQANEKFFFISLKVLFTYDFKGLFVGVWCSGQRISIFGLHARDGANWVLFVFVAWERRSQMAAWFDEQRSLFDLLVSCIFSVEILRIMPDWWKNIFTQEVDIFYRLSIFEHFFIRLEKLTPT